MEGAVRVHGKEECVPGFEKTDDGHTFHHRQVVGVEVCLSVCIQIVKRLACCLYAHVGSFSDISEF